MFLMLRIENLNWSDTIYPNLGYPVKNAENRHFCTKSDLKVLYPLVMFLKLMLRIVGVLINVLVLISQVAALNWSDTIVPKLRVPPSKTPKIDIFARKDLIGLYPLALRIVEVLNNVLVLISQVATLNWSDTIYPNLGYPVKNAKIDIFARKVIWEYFIH